MKKDEKKEFEGHLKQKVRPDVEEGGAGEKREGLDLRGAGGGGSC